MGALGEQQPVGAVAAGVVVGAGAVLLAALEEAALEVAGAEVTEGGDLGQDGAATGLERGDVGSGGSSRQGPSFVFILIKNKDYARPTWLRIQSLSG